MQYKFILYGSSVYKEILFEENFIGSLTIGTEKECQLFFRQEKFQTKFVLRIDRQENQQFIISCSDTIYLMKDNGMKEYVRYLSLGDHLSLCCDKTDMSFFYVDFIPAFDMIGTDYDMAIDCTDCTEMTIGGTVGCTIRIDDPIVAASTVRIRRTQNGYEIDASNADLGFEVNGYTFRSNIAEIVDGEFLSIKGYSFCLDNGIVYTTKKAKLITNQKKHIIEYQKNHYCYPKFILNARQRFKLPDKKIEVLNPNAKDESEEQNFLLTIMPMLANMLIMVGLRGVMGGGGLFVLYFAATMTISTTVSIISFTREKKKRREKEDRRQKVYMEYLIKKEDEIIELRQNEQKIANMLNPTLENYMTYIDAFDSRLFEKSREHEDYLTVRIGSGVVKSNCQIEYKKDDYVDTEDEFKAFPKAMHDKYEYISNMPVCLALKDVNAVGFIGSRTMLYQMEKNLIMEFAASHFYKNLKLFLIMEEEDVPLFAWARWMKITFNEISGGRNFMYDEESAKLSLEFLYSELSRREAIGKAAEGMEDYIVFVYKSQIISNHPVSKYISTAKEYGFHFVFFEEYEEFLNSACSLRIFLNKNNYTGYIQNAEDGLQFQAFEYSHISKHAVEQAAKKMACIYVDEVNLENTLTKNITLFKLLNILNPYDLDLGRRWSDSKIYSSMAAPIGVKSGDEIIYLDLHEKFHGPHGLVAGTTGSGKSEILQTYILAMSTLFHPYEVGFIIIDFKGGGMVNQFRDLPHLNGAITNIDGNEIERSLLSIKAELIKRQELFAEQNVNHINDYIKAFKEGKASTPLPHLILIVDEFAELKSEQPEFMKELISASRIGRSLGIHLILATQKPAGVVSDQIWSNSKFKLCLKVQNKNDSNEVLKSPLAAEIREPGRAYLQVGNNEIFQLFQSAYSGASAKTDGITAQKKFVLTSVALSGKRKIIYEQKPKQEDGGETQLQALVNYINEYCENNGIKRLPDICLPSLSDFIPFTLEGDTYTGTDVVIPVGVIDDPSRQLQYVSEFNLSQNNIYILGSSQSGKTNLLQTIICGLTFKYSPKELNIYILDFASMMLKNFEPLNHVGGIITAGDEEKLKSFLKLMQQTVIRRKNHLSKLGLSSFSAYREAGNTDMPQIVIILDNWVAFRGYFSEYEDAIISLSRESVSVGISLVVTAGQANGAGFKLLSNFAKRTALYCNDSSDYSSVFEACRKKINNIPGRGIVENNKNYYECQYYLAFAAEKEYEKIALIKKFINTIHEKYGNSYVTGIPEIPANVTETFMIKQFGENCFKAYEVPLGMEFNSIGKRTIELDKIGYMAFLGNEESGKQDYVKYVIKYVLSRRNVNPAEVYMIDNVERSYDELKDDCKAYTNTIPGMTKIATDVQQILSDRYKRSQEPGFNISDEPLQLIIINSASLIKTFGVDKELAAMYKSFMSTFKNLKICFLFTDIENVMISFTSGEVLKNLRETKKLLAFENIRSIKAVEVPMTVSREFKKPLERHDAYLFSGDKIEKIRAVNS